MKIKLTGLILILWIVLALTTGYGLAAPQAGGPVTASDVASALGSLPAGGKISVIVLLKEQVQPEKVGGVDKEERRRNLLKALRDQSDISQAGIRAFLRSNQKTGRVSRFTPLWIDNAIGVTAESDIINQLASFPEVARISSDAVIRGPLLPLPAMPAGAPAPNLNVINAPALWSLGYQGQGVVIASMDTGVDATHPDLAAQYRGGADSWYDPYAQHAAPVDTNGHGTWTMGVMVGGSQSGTALGVAPQAKWIAVKIFDDANTASTIAIHMGFQWLLDPDGNPLTNDAPNVVNNSWDMGSIGCSPAFEADIRALVAANISVVFAAGNDGPSSPSDVSPANYPEVFSAGATDNNDLIASFSSRGPTSCGRSSPSTFPDVVAPGVAIKTTDLFGLYNTVSGTSFAAPHLSGAIALLLSAQPGLQVDRLRTALTYTARDLGPAGPDAAYGNGRIDVLAAYDALVNGTLPTSTPTSIPTYTPTPLPPTATTIPPTATPALPSPTAVPPTATPLRPTATLVSPTPTAHPPTATPGPSSLPAHYTLQLPLLFR